MRSLNLAELRYLSKFKRGQCVSLYIEFDKNSPQKSLELLRQQIAQAEKMLLAAGVALSKIQKLLQPVIAFYKHNNLKNLAANVVIFLCKNLFEIYKVPLAIKPKVYVDKAFHFRPVMPLIREEDRHYILVISLKGVRFYKNTLFGIQEIPLDVEDIGCLEELFSKRASQNWYLVGNDMVNVSGSIVNVVEKGVKSIEKQYFSQVNQAVNEYLNYQDEPLLLAGTKSLQNFYKAVNTYSNLQDDGIEIENAWTLTSIELHSLGKETLKTYFGHLKRYIHEFELLALEGKTSIDIAELLPQAAKGEVKVLFIKKGSEAKGHFDTETKEVTQKADELTDLLQLAATFTTEMGGEVYYVGATAMPVDEADVAGILK